MAERLVVEEVSKVYPGGNHALKGPSFTVEPGAFMVLLGPSGWARRRCSARSPASNA